MNQFIIRYGLTFVFVAVAILVLAQSDYIGLIKRLTVTDILVSIALSLITFTLSGLKIGYLTQKHFQKRLSISDLITLPLSMNLWGFIIPVRGGLLYSVFFLKTKYKIKMVEGVSLSIYTYLLTVILIGGFGLYYTISNYLFFSIGTLISILLLLSPFILKILHGVLHYFPIKKFALLKKIRDIIDSIFINLHLILGNFHSNAIIILITLAHLLFVAISFYWATVVFDLNVLFVSVVMAALIVRLGMILSFTPGNLGVNELLSGGAFSMLGGTVEEGILIALFIRFSSILLTFTIGILAVSANMKYFNVSSIKSVFTALKNA